MQHQVTHEFVAREGFVHKGRQIAPGEVLGTITAHRHDFPSDHIINKAYNGKLELRRATQKSEPAHPAIDTKSHTKAGAKKD